jgi:hypothetical protein
VLYLKLKEQKLSFIVSCTGRKFTSKITMSIHPQMIEKDGIKECAVLPYQEFLEIQQILENFEGLQELRKAKAEEFNAPTRPLSAFSQSQSELNILAALEGLTIHPAQ